jgi:TRAP-type uncharacterized transport system substrate-binding protein
VKAVFDHQKELIATHAEYSNISIGSQRPANSSVPFHPGAVKYLKERGAKF